MDRRFTWDDEPESLMGAVLGEHRPMRFLLFGIILLFAYGVHAQTKRERPLTGTFFYSQQDIHLEPLDAKQTHLWIELTGESAKSLYERLKTEPKPYACGESGDRVKQIKGTTCIFERDKNAYSCLLGIDLNRQMVNGGHPC